MASDKRLGVQTDTALSWIAGNAAPLAPEEFRTVPVHDIHEHDYLRLREPPYPGLASLAEDIRSRGQTTPMFVRPRDEGGYDLIAGYRRRCALLEAGVVTALVRVYPGLNDEEALDLAVSENRDREDMSDWERAELAERLQKRGRSYDGIATALHLSATQVKRLLRVAKTSPPALRTALHQRQITLALATAFLELQLETHPEAKQEEFLAAAVEEECSVREWRRLVARRLSAKTPPPGPRPALRRAKTGAFALSLKVTPGDAQEIATHIDTLKEALRLARKLQKQASISDPGPDEESV